MEIFLVRHGRPEVDASTPIRGSELADWLQGYDAARLAARPAPPDRVRNLARRAGCVVSSSLRRSVESAELLAEGRVIASEAHFCEAELPGLPIRGRLNPQGWALLSRLAWFCGYAPGVESLRDARGRARAGASRLEALARAHGSALLVGHGIINALISRELRGRGWRGSYATFATFWAAARFERRDHPPGGAA